MAKEMNLSHVWAIEVDEGDEVDFTTNGERITADFGSAAPDSRGTPFEDGIETFDVVGSIPSKKTAAGSGGSGGTVAAYHFIMTFQDRLGKPTKMGEIDIVGP